MLLATLSTFAMAAPAAAQTNPQAEQNAQAQQQAQVNAQGQNPVSGEQTIIVLALEDHTYRVHGEFGPGTEATSVLLPGFAVAVDAVFEAAA